MSHFIEFYLTRILTTTTLNFRSSPLSPNSEGASPMFAWIGLLRRFAGPLVCAVLLGVQPTHALAGAKQTLRFDHIGKAQGLQDGSVTAILQDRMGLMWLGTPSGLLRFDGRRMTKWHFDPEAAQSLSHPLVLALLEGTQQELWIGTAAGLDRLDLKNDRIERVSMPSSMSLQQRRVWAIVQADQDRLWLASHTKLLRFSPRLTTGQPFESFDLPGEPGAVIRALISDGAGGVWVAVGSHVSHLDKYGRLIQHFDAAQSVQGAARMSYAVRSMALDHEQRLWLGLQKGLQVWRVRAGAVEQDTIVDRLGLKQARVFAFLKDEEQSLWIGFDGNVGLVRVQFHPQEEVEVFTHAAAISTSIAGNSIASIFQDRAGTLWVGTWDNGISLVDLRRKGFRHYLHIAEDVNSLASDTVMAMLADQGEKMWVATYGGGLNRLDLKSGEVERIPRAQTDSSNLKALLSLSRDELLIGGDEGLKRFHLPTRKASAIRLDAETPGGSSISSIIRDHRGDIWAGSAAGLYRLDANFKLTTFRANASKEGALSHDTVDCLLEDSERNLWIGTKGGLQLWDHRTERFTHAIKPSETLRNPDRLSIYGLHQDAKNRIWVATSFGLFQLLKWMNGWELLSWREVQGMPQGWVVTIQHDEFGDLWLGTEQGLVHLKVEQRVARGLTSIDASMEGVFNFGASARLPDGRLLFGAQNLLVLNPGEMKVSEASVPVVLSDILEFNRSLLDTPTPQAVAQNRELSSLAELGIHGLLRDANSIELKAKHAMMSFEFAALQFYYAKQNRLTWKLEGFDKEWIEGKPGETLITYTNLDQGDYVLRVKAAKASGAWSDSVYQLRIHVAPPVWRSWWFLVLMGVLTLLLLYAVYRVRIKFLTRAQEHLERQVAIRTLEAELQKDQLIQEKEFAEQQRENAEKARQDIALLSEIGRQISASLDILAIQNVFYSHVAKLMDADIYGIGLVNWDTRVIVFDRAMDCGHPIERYSRSLDFPEQLAVKCVLEARELLVDEILDDNRVLVSTTGADVMPMRLDGHAVSSSNSGLYVPMMIDGQVIGVITVLSLRHHAYQQTHLDILRTLSAYAAVALDKAAAHQNLKVTQSRLAEQEKLAALGSIVAGVAHELNTPIGNSLLVASTFKEQNDVFCKQIKNSTVRRSEIEQFCARSSEAIAIILRNLDITANLVSSFKQISIDQTSDKRRNFDLATICGEIVLALSARLKRDHIEVKIQIPSGIMMDSFPGPLGQVISNLIINASVHGLEGRDDGVIVLSAYMKNKHTVCLRCSDNGCGIPEKNIHRIFEPFFTTRFGQGGSGLGLNISYNLVRSILGGSIEVESQLGQGCCFIIDLPLVAPESYAPEEM